MVAELQTFGEHTGRPETMWPIYRSPADSNCRYVSCFCPIAYPAQIFIATCGGAHVEPELAFLFVASELEIFYIHTKLSLISLMYLFIINSKHFAILFTGFLDIMM